MILQVRVERELGTAFWIHQDGIDGVCFLNLSNANELDTGNVITACIYLYSYCTY